MMRNIKFKLILALFSAIIIFASGLFCCCFMKVAQAQEIKPSCHQTSQNTDSSHTQDDCGCGHFSTMADKVVYFQIPYFQFDVTFLNEERSHYLFSPQKILAYQAPPSIYDTQPLYLKYSVFRI